MYSGDSLSVLLFLLGSALGSMIGAVAAVGKRATFLSWLTAFFVALALAWIFAPAANTIAEVIRAFTVALVVSGAPVMVITIAVVALMLGGRAPPGQPPIDLAELASEVGQLPSFAVHPTTKWKPDITFREGLGYLGATSIWRGEYGNTIASATSELTGALAANKITAWGRDHPNEGELFEIARAFWQRAEVTLDTDYAFSHRTDIGAYNVHLCQKEMEQVWPPKES